ncbi:VanZ family protein [Pseudomonas frederiksbergensis]|uniref:VanZ family protein n=1 Tax=Pseudomonas frederiksbergensis TaxID=104087 RepID=UPI0019827256|nr:VanZ family protein [Pseudomonas frederiksbergensis]MBN3865736.1 VanZ family protein [Pseudomonas frederiksbergensis]
MITWLKGLVELPFWLRGLVFIAVTVILLFAGLRSQPIPELFAEEDKIHHWIGFLVFAFSCRLAFPNVKLRWIALGCLLTGVLIELAQGLMPLRTASPYDMLANCIGVLMGLLVARCWVRRS